MLLLLQRPVAGRDGSNAATAVASRMMKVPIPIWRDAIRRPGIRPGRPFSTSEDGTAKSPVEEISLGGAEKISEGHYHLWLSMHSRQQSDWPEKKADQNQNS